MSGAYYKGQQLDLERFRQLVLEKKPEYAQRPLGVKEARRLGLTQPLDLLAEQCGTREKVIRAAGFTTYREANPQAAAPSESELRERLMDYHRNPTSNPINLRRMHRDVDGGGAQLATALGRFAKKHIPPYTRTAANAIRHFGFKTNRTNNTIPDIQKALQKVWPKGKVEEVYAGDGTLDVPVNALETINPKLYSALRNRGIAQVVNAVYPDYPDLYWYVRAPQSPITPANPDSVRKQLLSRFYAGRSIGQGLRGSSDPNDRILFHRVLSLAPMLATTIVHKLAERLCRNPVSEGEKGEPACPACRMTYPLKRNHPTSACMTEALKQSHRDPQYISTKMYIARTAHALLNTHPLPTHRQNTPPEELLNLVTPIIHPAIQSFTPSYSHIVKALLPELSMDDINGNTPGAIYNTGRIGNLFVEWLLKWTMVMDPYGAFYRDGFKDVFTAPLRSVFAEKRLASEDGRLVPDFLVVGRQNTGIEVRTGEHARNAVELAKKYGDREYAWNIDGESYPLERTVAVLHMPERSIRKAAPQLTDAGFTVLDSERFLNYLELFTDRLEQSPWHEQFAAAAPRVHNARSLVDIYKQLAFYPATLTRPANSEAVAFAKQTLEELAAFEPAA